MFFKPPHERAVLHLISLAWIQHPHNLTNYQQTRPSTPSSPAFYPGWQLNTTWTTLHLQTLTLTVSLGMATSLRSQPRSAGQIPILGQMRETA